MKNIILFTGLVFLLIQCTVKGKPTIYENSKDKVVLGISTATTETELESIKKSLQKDHGISIDYSNTSFSSNGNVNDLDLKIKDKEGYSGSVQASTGDLSLKHFGFERDYNKNSAKPFYCGQIK